VRLDNGWFAGMKKSQEVMIIKGSSGEREDEQAEPLAPRK
jgi:hypothetical protein